MKYIEPAVYAGDIRSLVDRAVEYNEIIGLRGTQGEAVLMSQEEYDAILETIHIMRSPQDAREILEAAQEELEMCIAEEDVDW